MKNKTIQALLEGREENHQLPFLWLHGEDEATLRQMMAVIHGASCGAVCLESRTHPDFCGPQWWHDLDIILEEAKARGMRVWILDDKHYPSGMANGALLQAPEELCRQNIFCNRLALGQEAGPVALSLRQAGLLEGPGPTQEDIRQGFLPGEPARRFDPAGDRVLTVQAVKDGAVLDLSPFLQGEELRWDKPAGAWELQVVAASRNTGFHRDYINMLDRESVRLLLEAVYEPHWQRYSQEFGKTLAGFFSDEPNLGNGPTYTKGNTLGCGQDLPWSRELESALEESWGPGWRQELPRLFSQDSSEETARFHTAYMDLVTKLVREDFSQQVADWCHQRGVAYIGHVIEDDGQHCRTGSSLGHFFRGLQGQDMAGIDDIGGQVLPQGEDGPALNPKGRPRNGEFYHYGLGTLAASSAALEPGKAGNAMCEIFGNYGWQEGVRLEKYLADHFLVRGINFFVPHAFTGHPFPDPDCPPHFYAQGHNPQYRHFGKLLQAMNRVATVTSSGPHRVEAAVLYHGESEWCDPQAMAFERPLRPLYDQQIHCHVVPADVFAEPERYHTQLGNPLVINGRRYQAFVVPGAKRLPAAAAAGLEALVQAGLPVFFAGEMPLGLCEGGPLPSALEACPVLEPAALPGALREAGGQRRRRPRPATGCGCWWWRAKHPAWCSPTRERSPMWARCPSPGWRGPASGTTPGTTAARGPSLKRRQRGWKSRWRWSPCNCGCWLWARPRRSCTPPGRRAKSWHCGGGSAPCARGWSTPPLARLCRWSSPTSWPRSCRSSPGTPGMRQPSSWRRPGLWCWSSPTRQRAWRCS